MQRAKDHAPDPDKRFHYRYVSSESGSHRYSADNDMRHAPAPALGTMYLKDQDPKPRDKFYKALVWRNLNLPYAQAADKKR